MPAFACARRVTDNAARSCCRPRSRRALCDVRPEYSRPARHKSGRALEPAPTVDSRPPPAFAGSATGFAPQQTSRESGTVTNDISTATAPSDSASHPDGYLGDPAVQADWDKLYLDREQLWSGQPNGALVAEVAGLTPGRALDVGCGEGADAVWLAGGGWDVTAIEVSGVALERAARHARDAGVAVHWVHAGLAEAALPPASFDLVSAQYP